MKGRDTTTQPALEEKEGRNLLTNQPTDILRDMGSFFRQKNKMATVKRAVAHVEARGKSNKIPRASARAARLCLYY